MSGNESREATLDDVLDELRSHRRREKDFRDSLGPILTFISSLVIGATGAWFTWSYNMAQSAANERQHSQAQAAKKHESRILEMQAVEKFMPYLTAENEKKKEVALLVITTLGSPEFATQFVRLNPSQGTRAATDKIMASAQTSNQVELPQSVTARPASRQPQPGVAQATKRSGWVYLGHYLAEARRWETRYFDFGIADDPANFLTLMLKVREETGPINVRIGMPSPAGEFQRVGDVLKPPSQVIVRSVREWSSTGYMWAEVEYET